MTTISKNNIVPVSHLDRLERYNLQTPRFDVVLKLDLNEGPANLTEGMELDLSCINRYPKQAEIEALIASKFGVDSKQVLVTAGGDEAIDRVCRAYLGPDRNMLFPVPSFEMIRNYALMTGCEVKTVSWENRFPTEQIINLADENTKLVSIVSPNNPTGRTVGVDALAKLGEQLSSSILLVDQAYAEFEANDGDDDSLTSFALKELSNAVVIRTFSKAWGLAGLRVGFAIGPERIIDNLRRVGGPFSVSSISLAIIQKLLLESPNGNRKYVDKALQEREALENLLTSLNCTVSKSQGNFVFVQPPENIDAKFFYAALSTLGILVRLISNENALRITCPGNRDSFDLLCQTLENILRPQSILFDMDGVLVDESPSYREAILQTCRHFKCDVSAEEIAEKKLLGDANNDWIFTKRLLAEYGIEISLDSVKREFERIYQGDESNPGLWDREIQLVEKQWLEKLSQKFPLGIVTGRPRNDAVRFLRNAGLERFFSAIVCMEDGPAKPAPDNVLTAMKKLNVQSAWMIGDTPDDINAARQAGLVSVGIVAPHDDAEFSANKLINAGAAQVVENLSEFEELIP